ncbi:MAG TPA: septum formation initiator family protein [Terracidiphilus sp.]
MREPSTPEMFAPPPEPKPEAAAPLPQRALRGAVRAWRTAGSVVAVLLALLLGWHVVTGQHGLSVWEQKRVEEKQLTKEIDDLQQENSRLRVRVDKLKSDPDAIEREAREKLRYAKQGEVIVDLSGEAKPQAK